MTRTILSILFLLLTSQFIIAGGSSKTDIEIYNEGVDLMLELNFKKAEKKFRKALKDTPELAQAHNNLAYCLRKQGEDNYEEAMMHYNKAIELKPNAPEPYMYRGVLFMSMGNKDAALKDHQKLLELEANQLAGELEWVIGNSKEKEPEQFFGVFQKITG